MRIAWRTFVLIILAALWPQLGCHHLPTGGAVKDPRPVTKDSSAKKDVAPAASPLARAKEMEDAQRYPEAITLYEKARMTEPGAGDVATRRLAVLHLRLNDLDRADQEYQLLLKTSPRDPDLLCALGDLNYRRGHFGLAEKMLNDALSRKPDHAKALATLGMTLAHRAQGSDYSDSIEAFKKVGFSEAEAYCKVAFVMKVNNKLDDAVRAYQTALAKDPNLEMAKTAMAQLYQADPSLAVRLTTHQTSKRGFVDIEAGPNVPPTGTGRTAVQHPTLPPPPDFDLRENGSREWSNSAKQK